MAPYMTPKACKTRCDVSSSRYNIVDVVPSEAQGGYDGQDGWSDDDFLWVIDLNHTDKNRKWTLNEVFSNKGIAQKFP